MSDRVPTFADICNAIAEGHIPASIEDSMYQVNALELRRYFHRLHPLAILSLSQSQDAGTCSDGWSGTTRHSVA